MNQGRTNEQNQYPASIIKGSLFRLLTNATYTGKVAFKGTIYDDEHDGIVDIDLWQRVQDALLFLPRTVKGRDPIREKDVRPITAVAHRYRQRKMWAKLVKNRVSS